MSSQLSKLKFRIVFCSSEDNEFPVTQLLNHGPHSTGWQSARFQDFPQIIILQFIAPVRIQQLQFLSHQSKIATRIELFTYLPENPSSIPPLENFKWNRLGYLSLDNNEKSGFQARELKSVYIDSQALFLKVSLNKCHVNKYNIFNQVGLIAINCLGEELGSIKGPSKGIQPRLENEMEFDSATNDRLKQLYEAKDRAIENEDFDEAKRIKDAIERLKSVGYELLMLEDRKRNAIASEDYDGAKILKIEIERMRNAVLPPMPDTYFAPVQQSSHRPFSGGPQPLGIGGRPSSRPQPSQFPPPQQIGSMPDYDPFERRTNQLLPEPKSKVSHDEQVIPTMSNGRAPGQIFGGEEEENLPPNLDNPPEPLGVQQSKFADPLLPILGEDLCRRIFSKAWQFREDGLGIIQNEVSQGSSSQIFGGSDNSNIYSGVLGAVRYTVGDKVAQVSLKSMGLINTLLNSIAPTRAVVRGDVPEHIQSILSSLLDKVGDNNARVRESAEQTFISLTRSDVVGVGPAVQSILKPMKDKSTSQKHIIGRLNLLDNIVKEFQIDNSYVPFQPVAEYALNGFKNTSQDVRNAAFNLLMSIYACIGQKLQPYLSDLRPAQLEMLEKGMQDIDGGNAPNIMVSQPPPRQQPINAPKRKSTNPPAAMPFCQFCGKKDTIFANEDNLDIHYWKDCPMLVSCPYCSQVIEIFDLNSHLMKECDLKSVMSQCPRCKEAIHADEFEQHVEEQSCYAAKPPKIATRCPLCHEDVEPGIEGWKNHILTQGCPNNDRSNI
ncbi:unnamed protein product [Blepharisma stoltei]|uniref:UVR domain-containing protein n=1 Tax=Blepharisma stoltei TaxID=1481888 RepID=A0AAU9JB97_9CILI|nr:unnamed protein product [Blepharisma stoltei]